jgi:hypothetical protein
MAVTKKISGSLRKFFRGVQRHLPVMPFQRFQGKIASTLEFQKLCDQFDLPFERAILFKKVSRFNARKFVGVKRIMVRLEDERKEFVIEHASPEQLDAITAEIKEYIHAHNNAAFLVQSLGLREELKSVGEIRLISSTEPFRKYVLEHGERPYYVKNGSTDVFSAFTGNSFLLKSPHLGEKEAGFVSSELGVKKAPGLFNTIFMRLHPGQVVVIRFVKYKGETHACFFDARIH